MKEAKATNPTTFCHLSGLFLPLTANQCGSRQQRALSSEAASRVLSPNPRVLRLTCVQTRRRAILHSWTNIQLSFLGHCQGARAKLKALSGGCWVRAARVQASPPGPKPSSQRRGEPVRSPRPSEDSNIHRRAPSSSGLACLLAVPAFLLRLLTAGFSPNCPSFHRAFPSRLHIVHLIR
jgi:hypothetical protein